MRRYRRRGPGAHRATGFLRHGRRRHVRNFEGDGASHRIVCGREPRFLPVPAAGSQRRPPPHRYRRSRRARRDSAHGSAVHRQMDISASGARHFFGARRSVAAGFSFTIPNSNRKCQFRTFRSCSILLLNDWLQQEFRFPTPEKSVAPYLTWRKNARSTSNMIASVPERRI